MITELLPDTWALPSNIPQNQPSLWIDPGTREMAALHPAIQSVEPNHLPEAEVPIQAEQLIVVWVNDVSSSLRRLWVRGL